MRVDLAGLQRPEHRDRGMITAPDGRGYTRRTTRTGRRTADAMIAGGSALVVDLVGHGRFEWLDADDALSAWAEARPHVVTTEPTLRQRARHVTWTAGIWSSDDGPDVLYLLGRC